MKSKLKILDWILVAIAGVAVSAIVAGFVWKQEVEVHQAKQDYEINAVSTKSIEQGEYIDRIDLKVLSNHDNIQEVKIDIKYIKEGLKEIKDILNWQYMDIKKDIDRTVETTDRNEDKIKTGLTLDTVYPENRIKNIHLSTTEDGLLMHDVELNN